MVVFKFVSPYSLGRYTYLYEPLYRGKSHYHRYAKCVKLCQKGPEKRVTSIFFSNNSDLYFGEPFMTLLIWNEQNLVEKNILKGKKMSPRLWPV